MFNRTSHRILEPNGSDITSDSQGSRRLIGIRVFCDECDVDCGHEVRLLDKSMVHPKHVTLSHCGGRRLGDNGMTANSSLPICKSRIRLEDIPTNLGDAIGTTRRLGVRCFWIDALGIIQDSQEDWAIESVNMGYTYDVSYLTIAASSSRDNPRRCYRSSELLTQAKLGEQKPIVIRNKLTDSRPATLILWAPTMSDETPLREPTPLLDCPRSQRGWVFEERLFRPGQFTSRLSNWFGNIANCMKRKIDSPSSQLRKLCPCP